MCLCKNNCTIQIIVEKYLWLVIIFLVVVFSLPSLFRIYDLKYLYSSEEIRTQSIEAISFLRKNQGWGATDLKLNSIKYREDGVVYNFKYIQRQKAKLFKTYIQVVYSSGNFFYK